ncbi:hypothetical protein [Allohahella sp. A8]|uniref:hypothetical protein n=1 Tax=Allohahella sp. A8 TaxID=3141461 RepID=UPI003A80FD8F
MSAQQSTWVKSNVLPFTATRTAGFYVTPRSLKRSDAWRKASLVQRDVLSTVLDLAEYKSSAKQIGSVMVYLSPGDLLTTQANLTAECSPEMTRDKLKRGLAYWKKQGVLTFETVEFQAQTTQEAGPEKAQNKRNRITLIRLCNYEEFTVSYHAEKTEQAQSRPREAAKVAHSLVSNTEVIKTLDISSKDFSREDAPTKVDPELDFGSPEPSPEPAKPKAKRKAKAPGTCAPDALEITDAMFNWAQKTGVTVDLVSETEQFLDHHRGAGNLKTDWIATWRTWMRNSIKFGAKNKPRFGGPRTIDDFKRENDEQTKRILESGLLDGIPD